MSLVLCISKNVARPDQEPPVLHAALLHLVAPDFPQAASLIGGDVVEVTSKGPIDGIFLFKWRKLVFLVIHQ